MGKNKATKPEATPANAGAAPKAAPAKTAASSAKTALPETAPVHVPPLFRQIDWLAMLITFAIVAVGYYLTIAPELTLEDSGELCTGSFYAAIPHPPGYPVWSIYSWLWTQLPFGNIAWRVALAEVFAGSLACGLLALMVSRGSSMLMESIDELKEMTGKWESAICLVAAIVAGLLMGFDGFMWKESVVVNRISVFGVPWILTLLLFLLRWMYAPHQYRYVYAAIFMFGVCLTIHQSLLVASIGIEIAIALRKRSLGRDMFLFNSALYFLYLVCLAATGHHLSRSMEGHPGQWVVFNLIGLLSVGACAWLTIETRALLTEWKAGLVMGGLLLLGVSFYLYMAISGMTNPPMQWGYPRTVEGFWHAITRGQYEQPNPTNLITEFPRFCGQVWMLISGVAEEFTWVYMFVALVPFIFLFKMKSRERAWIVGLAAIYFFLGVFLMILFNPSTDRQSADLIKVFFNASHTIVATMIGYGLALIAAYMATHYQSFRRWGLAGGGVAAVLAIFCLYEDTATNYFGREGLSAMPLREFPHWVAQSFAQNQFGLPVYAGLLLVGVVVTFVLGLVLYRQRAPLAITLAVFMAMPMYSILAHWFGSEQREHMFGYWFGHDMFTPPFKGKDGKPIYPPMTKDAILYGGTDPGRFCPTYMIFCESFTPHNCQPAEDQQFDRRDVYIITQNALADGTYLNYIRAHYNRSKQIDSPFFQEFLRSDKERERRATNIIARMLSPVNGALDRFFTAYGDQVEKRRRTYTSWFEDKDFTDFAAFAAKLRPIPSQDPLSAWLYQNLSKDTQALLSGSGNDVALRKAVEADLNRLLERELLEAKALRDCESRSNEVTLRLSLNPTSEKLLRQKEEVDKERAALGTHGPLYTPDRFKQVAISEYLQDFIKEDPKSHTRIRLNRLLLEAAYPKEIAKSLGGVYPDREMYIATPEDSQICFNEYMADATRRFQHDAQFPNEPRQVKPGEDLRQDGQRVQVSGQTAVMSINGLLTKVMFDHNPKNEFFVEESFPLDWMYPHLTPFGIIMKINRNPLPSLSEEVFQKDHDFWKQFSKRMTGDIIDYDTSVKQVCEWIEKVYLRRNFEGFTGDRKFIRDDDAQKAFSKLRSSIGGVYAWRLHPGTPREFQPKNNEETQRLIKEANFTFLQAFAFCPYSPEAVFRYVQFLAQFQRFDDALLVAKTCVKFDPGNRSILELVNNLSSFKSNQGNMDQITQQTRRFEEDLKKNPANFQAAFALASLFLQTKQNERAIQVLDNAMNNPKADGNVVLGVVQAYAQMGAGQKLEGALEKLTKVMPENPEAWFDLAAYKATVNKAPESMAALRQALELSAKRLKENPTAHDLLGEARRDPRFNILRQLPDFQKLVTP